MTALFLSRRVFDFLAGTGFKEDLDDVFDKLEATLKRKDFLEVRNLDRRSSMSTKRRTYTLLLYKKGIYLVAKSLHHNAIRIFALDGFRAVDWLRGDRFDYPADYDPARLNEGSFGLMSGPRERVRIFFDESVSRYVRRRRWHPTQRIRKLDGGIELTERIANELKRASSFYLREGR